MVGVKPRGVMPAGVGCAHNHKKKVRVMRAAKPLLLLTLFALLAACGKAVPQEKSAYVGEWRATGAYLVITQDGSVHYERRRGGASSSLDMPLKGFTGDNFDVGVGPFSTTFIVSKPPHQDGDKWKMVVNDLEMVKSED